MVISGHICHVMFVGAIRDDIVISHKESPTGKSIKSSMGPYQWTPKYVARAIRHSGLGVRSVGPVGDFLEKSITVSFLYWLSSCPSCSYTHILYSSEHLPNWVDAFPRTEQP